MDKEEFKMMLKDFLKESGVLKVNVEEDSKSPYDYSKSFTVTVELGIDSEVILSASDSLYLSY